VKTWITENKRKFLGMLTAILFLAAVIGFTAWHYTIQPIGNYKGVLNSEDCDISENFYIGVEKNTYYPENETAVLELNRTANLTSEYLKSMRISVKGGEVSGDGEARIKIGDNLSEDGLIAEEKSGLEKFLADRSSENESKPATNFPVQPVKITVLGGDGDDDGDGNTGVERGEAVYLEWTQRKVAVKNYCRKNVEIPFLVIPENESRNISKHYFNTQQK